MIFQSPNLPVSQSQNALRVLVLCLFSYLLGSIPFGILVGRLCGTDLRKAGSGNIGAANAVRTLGFLPGFVVLLGDMSKSILALGIAKRILGVSADPRSLAIIGACAILGHNASCFLKLRGGKGVASTLGVFLFLSWKATLCAFGVWIFVVAFTQVASLGSLLATFLLPFFMMIFKEPPPYVIFGGAAFIFIVYKHRGNIRRLLRGEEKKLSFSKPKEEMRK